VGAVADHQPPAILINLTRMGLDEHSNLSLQRCREHLPGTVTDDLITQRDTGPVRLVAVRLVVLLDYLEHGRTFPTSAPTHQRRP
jgi:hypothetical protein